MIELDADIDIVGADGFEGGDVFANAANDVERGRIGALGDLHVDGAFAVDMRVGGDDVRAVFYGGDIAEEGGGRFAGTEGGGEEVLQMAAEGGVRLHEIVEIANADVAGGLDGTGLIDDFYGFFRRDAMGAHFIGIEADDDGALVASKGRRRGDAGECGEERADAVERDVLHLRGRARGAGED